MARDKSCKTCMNGTMNRNGTIACGAPFERFEGDTQLPSPIWAERKRSPFFMILIMNGSGYSALKRKYGDNFFPSYEADWIHPLDGGECKVWQLSPAFDADQEWHDISRLGSRYEEQISLNGHHRHRPRSFNSGQMLDDFGQDEWVTRETEWRLGKAPLN